MENKFNLTIKENIFIARRNMVDYIFNAAKLEGMEITFVQVQIIVDGITVPCISVKDTITIHNLKRAWDFIMKDSTLCLPADFELATQISIILNNDNKKIVADTEASTIFEDISKIPHATERAIKSLIFVSTYNMFYNMSLTAGIMLANQIMVANGAGIVSIPVTLQANFLTKLHEFSCSKDSIELAEFLYENCIDGIHLNEVRG